MQILPLRTFWRLRLQLVQLQADEIRRMQKALDEMNVRIHKVITDLVGVTGRAIITAILQGERRPEVLATYRDRRLACSEEELREALTGHYRLGRIRGQPPVMRACCVEDETLPVAWYNPSMGPTGPADVH